MSRKTVLALLVVTSLVVSAAPAGAEVSDAELRRAAADLERARAEAGVAGTELAAGRAEAARLRAQLERLVDEMAEAEVRFAAARRDALERVRSLYVGAGNLGVSRGEGGTTAAVRRTYAAAVSERDREVLNALAGAAADRDRLHRALEERAREQAVLAQHLEDLAAGAARALAEAEEEYARVRAAWDAQEAERRAAAAAAAAAALTTTSSSTTSATTTTSGGGATTTTTTPTTTTEPSGGEPTTTTTTLPPVYGGTFPPMVERWRPLVATYFPPELVDEALAIIACESWGMPDEVHPVTGAAGLFQHMPRYFPARTAAAGFPGASPLEPEPNIAAAAWLVQYSLRNGLPAWYFWSCKVCWFFRNC